MQGVNDSTQTTRRMNPNVELAAVVTVSLTAIFMLAARPLGISPGKTLLGGATILGAGGLSMAAINIKENFSFPI